MLKLTLSMTGFSVQLKDWVAIKSDDLLSVIDFVGAFSSQH